MYIYIFKLYLSVCINKLEEIYQKNCGRCETFMRPRNGVHREEKAGGECTFPSFFFSFVGSPSSMGRNKMRNYGNAQDIFQYVESLAKH